MQEVPGIADQERNRPGTSSYSHVVLRFERAGKIKAIRVGGVVRYKASDVTRLFEPSTLK